MKLVGSNLLIGVVSVVPFIFLAIVLVGYSFLFTREELTDVELEKLEIAAREQSSKLENMFENVHLQAENISKNISVQLNENDDDFSQTDLQDLLELYSIEESFLAIYAMDETGFTWHSTDESFLGQNYSFRNYFQQAIDGNPYTDIALGVTSKEIGYFISEPIYSEDSSNIIGVLVVKLDPNFVLDRVTTSFFPVVSEFNVKVLDQNGVILHSRFEDDLFKSIGPITESVPTEELLQRYGSTSIDSFQHTEVQEDLPFITDIQIYRESLHEDGEKKIVVVGNVQDAPLFIFAESDTDTIVTLSNQLVREQAIFTLISISLISIFIWFLIQLFIRPLKQLIREVESISDSKKPHLSINTKSSFKEISQLKISFNNLLQKLNASKDNIEEEVEERTEDLSKTNNMMVGRELKMMEMKNEIENLKKELMNYKNNEEKSDK